MRWIAVALLSGFMLLLMAAVACTDEEGDDAEEVSTPTAEEAADTPEPSEPGETETAAEPTEPPEPTAPPVTYEVASREDVSFGATVRVVYRVEVSGPLTEEELRRIAQEIIDDETGQQDVNAIGFFFYLPGTDTSGVYTAGSADWAPGGDWASADTVEAGDYSGHELGAIDIVGS